MRVVQLSKVSLGAVLLLAVIGCSAAEETQGTDEQTLDASRAAKREELSGLRELQPIKDVDSAPAYETPASVRTLIGAEGMPPGAYQSTIACVGSPQCKFIHIPPCTRNERQCYKGFCVISDLPGCVP
jgi:hypothetical protein